MSGITDPNMKTVLFKFGTRSQNANYMGKSGEITIDIQTPTIVIHDGKTQGGKPMPSPNHTHTFTDLYTAGKGISINGAEIGVVFGTDEGTVMRGNQQFSFNGDITGQLTNGIFTLTLRDVNTLDVNPYDQVSVNEKGQVVAGVRLLPDLASATEGQTLFWDAVSKKFKLGNITATGGVTSLDGLSDVVIDPKLAKQVLAYDITSDTFKNLIINASWLSDFDVATPVDWGKLIWNPTAKKFKTVKDQAAALAVVPVELDTLILSQDLSSQWLRFNKPTPQLVIIQNDTTLDIPIGTTFEGVQVGVGSVTFSPAAPVIINRLVGKSLTLLGNGAHFKLVKAAGNTWDLIGDLGV